ncbi:MAG: hypothetical protein EOO28_20990 [Comamonadaceae bacterium]|nr:MAG: hypothetical protein EOO28_20990 [Comamonadaceae bacterium]
MPVTPLQNHGAHDAALLMARSSRPRVGQEGAARAQEAPAGGQGALAGPAASGNALSNVPQPEAVQAGGALLQLAPAQVQPVALAPGAVAQARLTRAFEALHVRCRQWEDSHRMVQEAQHAPRVPPQMAAQALQAWGAERTAIFDTRTALWQQWRDAGIVQPPPAYESQQRESRLAVELTELDVVQLVLPAFRAHNA